MSEGLAEIKEDTPEKVRRNLVVFATGMVAIAFLDAKFKASFFGVSQIGDVHPVKAWAFSLGILLYLRARYMLSKQYSEHAQSFNKGKIETVKDRLENTVATQLKLLMADLPTRSMAFRLPAPDSPIYRMHIPDPIQVHWIIKGRKGLIAVNWREPISDDPNEKRAWDNGPDRITVLVNPMLHIKLRFQAWREAHGLTSDVLEYRFPVQLANVAIACAIYKALWFMLGLPSLVDAIVNEATTLWLFAYESWLRNSWSVFFPTCQMAWDWTFAKLSYQCEEPPLAMLWNEHLPRRVTEFFRLIRG